MRNNFLIYAETYWIKYHLIMYGHEIDILTLASGANKRAIASVISMYVKTDWQRWWDLQVN